MHYRNTEMKLDQLVAYLNEEKVNLSPAFQRGQVWKIKTRQKLIANIVQGKPIPAIFLYKEASAEAAMYSYNILDGKQRLESIILFIGGGRTGDGALRIDGWDRYFFEAKLREKVGFAIDLPGGRKTYADLPPEAVRELREYAIPTVEINLQDDSGLDEIINLFLDINQQGVPVSRFDIVKAMGDHNRLLKSVFDLIAIKQRRGQVDHYKAKSNEFTRVLRRLDAIARLTDGKSRVDRTWQILLEIAMFYQSRRHRKPVDILKSFISASKDPKSKAIPALRSDLQRGLRRVFAFICEAYKQSDLKAMTLATDHTRFYTMITSLIDSDLMATIDETELRDRLVRVGRIIDGTAPAPTSRKVAAAIKKLVNLASDRTTDTPRREDRQKSFIEAVSGVSITEGQEA